MRTANDREVQTEETSAVRLGRRQLLKMSAAAAAAGGLGSLALPASAATGSGHSIAGHHANWVPRPSTLWGWSQQLHDFGPIRDTGSPRCRAFEEWLADQFTALGCTIERDHYRFTGWEASVEDNCSIAVQKDDGGQRELEVLSYWPFAASTRDSGPVSGRVLYAPGFPARDAAEAIVANTPAEELADSIVVIDMPAGDTGGFSTPIPEFYPETFPEQLPEDINAPQPGSHVGGGSGSGGISALMDVLQERCKGLIVSISDVSDDAARYEYLPFGGAHRMIPGLWVGSASLQYLQSVSGRANVTMRLDATLTPESRADTIVATLPGRSDDVIFMTSHTDGPNEVNDNGALGVLGLARYASRVPFTHRRRTHVFSATTGHYAGGAFADPVTGTGRRAGTSGVLRDHPEIAEKIVAQIALEQIGAMQWVNDGESFVPTGNVAHEYWIPTPAVADVIIRMFLAATETEDPRYSRSLLVESGAAGGEGGSLRSQGIPGIGLMGRPVYFFRADPAGVTDKLNPNVMYNQVSISSKLMVLMDRLSLEQLNGQAPITDEDLFGPPGHGKP